MPKRMLRDWTDSTGIDGLSAESERLFVRLIMKADDYGRFHADPRMVKALCFPLVDNLRANDLTRWLEELSHRQLILCYEADSRKYLVIPNFGQRLKDSKAKFPPLPGYPADWLPCSGNFPELPGSGGKSALEEKGREEEEKRRRERALLPFDSDEFTEAWGQWKAYSRSIGKAVNEIVAATQLSELKAMGEARAIAMIRDTIRNRWKNLREDSNRQQTTKPRRSV